MGTTEQTLHFPLDDDGFLRRECSLCKREFKVHLTREEREPPADSVRKSFLIPEDERRGAEPKEEGGEHYCPYCGQAAGRDSWWTQDQVAYIHTALRNIAAQLVNENLIRPLKRSLGRHTSGPVTIRFEGRELGQQEEWIGPEPNDMTRFRLPCCDREIKITEDWSGRVHCFFCGFPHERALG